MKITKKLLPDYQLKIIEDNEFFLGKNEKLIANLGNKRKYKLQLQLKRKNLCKLRLQLKNFIGY